MMIIRGFSDFFKYQWKSRPEVQLPGQKGIRGFMEEVRAREFQSAEYQAEKWKSVYEPQFSASVYKITGQHLSVMLALYKDNTLLWLDDHSSDTDFSEFLRREDLLTWMPDRINHLTEVLVETKFNFLGWPRPISSASDIDIVPDRLKKRHSVFGQGWVQGMLEAENRIADIAKYINPPSYSRSGNDKFQLQFYVWTKLFGQIIKIDCFLTRNCLFDYKGVQLADSIGFFTIPS